MLIDLMRYYIGDGEWNIYRDGCVRGEYKAIPDIVAIVSYLLTPRQTFSYLAVF